MADDLVAFADAAENRSDLVSFADSQQQDPNQGRRQEDLVQFADQQGPQDFGDEFAAGVSMGTDNLQASLFGLMRLAGSEIGSDIFPAVEGLGRAIEDVGQAGIDRNMAEIQELAPSVAAFSQVESWEDFWRWSAGALGQAVPSLGTAVASGGIGGTIAKKAVESKMRNIIGNRMFRTMQRKGFTDEQAEAAISRMLRSQAGIDMVRNGMTRGVQNSVLLNRGFTRGATMASVLASSPQQAGEAANSGVEDLGLALGAGLLGGSLEALPALRLIDRMFPGVPKPAAGNYIRDFARATGTQAVLEGSTEAAQEVIQLAALAYHDPNFDFLDPDNATQVLDAFAAGALVGAVTGGGAEAIGGATRPPADPSTGRPTIATNPSPSVTDGLPSDFEPADNTVFEEVRNRMQATVDEVIAPAMNTIGSSFQEGVNRLSRVSPAFNEMTDKLAGRAQEAQNSFLDSQARVLEDVQRYAGEQVAFIVDTAGNIVDTGKRNEFIAKSLNEAREQLQNVAETLRRRAQRAEQQASEGIDRMGVFDDDFGTSGRTDTDFIFGQQVNGQPSRGETAVPYKTRESARNQIARLRERFPSAPESAFSVREVDDGFVVGIDDSGMRDMLVEDEIVMNAISNARASARKNPNRNQRQARVQLQGVAGQTFLDVPTLVNAARRLGEGDNQTVEQAFLEISGRLLERGMIGDDGFQALQQQFERIYKPEARRFGIRRAIEEESDPVLREAIFNAETLTQEAREAPGLQGDEQAFIDEGDGRNLETEAQQARRQSSASTAKPKPKPKPKKVPPINQLQGKGRVKVWLPVPRGETKVRGRAKDALEEMADKLASLMSDKVKIRIVNRYGLQRMVDEDHPHAQYADDLLDLVGYGIRYDHDSGVAYIMIDNLENPGQTVAALVHEMGHLLHYDTWEQLTQAEQEALWKAFEDDVKSGNRTTGGRINRREARDLPRAEINSFEFREWMADQFVDWVNNRSEPSGIVKKFFEQVKAKIDAMWDFLKLNPGRFGQLNETYAEYADAVMARVKNQDAPGNEKFFTNDGPRGRPYHTLWDDAGDVNPRGVTTNQWDMVKKRLSDYPGVVRNAEKIYNFIHSAYKLALAPSTGAIRDIGTEASDRLATIFNRTEHGKPKATRNYHQRLKLMRGQFMNRWDKMKIKDNEKANLLRGLREIDGNPERRPVTLREKQVRKLFDDLHDYLRDSGLPVGKVPNYFPRTFNREKLIANKEKIIRDYVAFNFQNPDWKAYEQANKWYNALISREADETGALGGELEVDPLMAQSPSFQAMRSRSANAEFMNPYLEDNIDYVVSNYINAAVKRAEYNRALGSDAPASMTGGDSQLNQTEWNPNGKYDELLTQARSEGATSAEINLMKQYVQANLGQLGRDSVLAGERSRAVMATIVAYQNMRTLLFTVFASLPDTVGPAIRSGNMKNAFKTMFENLKEAGTDQSRLAEMARAWGVISSAHNQHIMTEYVDNHYMPASVRKWNDKFFQLTGLNYYTDFTRKAALAVGIDTIKYEAAKTIDPTKTQKEQDRAKQFLGELGLTADMVFSWQERLEPVWGSPEYDQNSAVDQQIAEALVQFVDESIMSPNASQRPILASHPAAMLIFHLKGYIYAIHDTILKRMAHNFKIADNPAQIAGAIAPAVLMMMLTAVGLELRELVTGNDRTAKMDGWEYTWETAERSGLLGLAQLGLDFEDAGARGQSEFAALGGPALDQFGDLLSRPASQTIPKAIPIVSQLPWARDALREATPL